ncbi:MAG: TolC family protein [Limisphaerales bacterium]
MRLPVLPLVSLLALVLLLPGRAGEPPALTNAPAWLTQPLSLADCLNLAFQQNGAVLRSRQDLEASHGLSVQTRAILIPKVQASGEYGIVEESAVDSLQVDSISGFPAGIPVISPGTEHWAAGLRLVQSVFEGGRMLSSVRTARLIKEQALAGHDTVLADTATEVRTAYYEVLRARQEIEVAEASIELLQRELVDNERRFNAGTVPRFNVLRAEVELANARPRLSQARNAHRLAKNVLVNRLGFRVPKEIWEDIPLNLTDGLDLPRLEIEVPQAVAQALDRRPELVALRTAERLRQEGVVGARAGALPRVQGYAGYGARKSNFSPFLEDEVHGWEAGVQASWNVFDGALTRGKVIEARALLSRAEIETDDVIRQIELEVRSSCSTLVEAWEVLQSQLKVQEQADEALRLARARSEAGTGTQLDVLGAQTALTDARTTQVRAKYAYAIARTHLERAIGAYLPEPARPSPGGNR